ncbi:hypothetical protein QF034_000073 [Streptomyces africanus]|uniref:Bacterial bifunctional deaminase-reductase C-terminal domain-containing protein n=1 Tax=Streptomyces africanus TaxID=231024 RepID=A0ABU0QH84_9ACTN|nr:dihydrofolate reductase family protein [Streptomyces africanus]MDQ0745842.1 hypothetical protein [Streptomyces africanus]
MEQCIHSKEGTSRTCLPAYARASPACAAALPGALFTIVEGPIVAAVRQAVHQLQELLVQSTVGDQHRHVAFQYGRAVQVSHSATRLCDDDRHRSDVLIAHRRTGNDAGETTILRSLDEVAALKETEGGPIIVHGSAALNQSLSDAGLIDRYHLLVFPLLLGAGKRLFSATDKDTQKLKLVEHEAYANGLQKNVFEVVR